MEAKAQARYVRCTPMKARRIVNLVRGMRTDEAIEHLRFAPQAAAETVRKLVESALANAQVIADRDSEAYVPEEFVISEAYVDEGPTMKRIRPRAKGRADQIFKRTSHITIVVDNEAAPVGAGAGKKARTR